ncbi:MAG: sterol desaturase family protein [Alphaproteobacteria bacterium]|nr:sterol desaturase family protein [Alphaproteobacteria bacterium]
MLYNLVFFSFIGLFLTCLFSFNIEISVCFTILIVAMGIVLTLLELFIPRNKEYCLSKSEFGLNLGFVAIDRFIYKPFFGFIILEFAYPYLATLNENSVFYNLWPRESHWLFQSFLAYFCISFSSYWSHRFMHTIPVLWRIHRLHHMPQKLSWFVTYWNHPFHFLMTTTSLWILPIFFGIPMQAMILPFMVNLIVSTMNHANFKTGRSILGYIFPTIWEHEIHHSQKIEESMKNIGVSTMFWDYVFGTYKFPSLNQKISIGVKECSYKTMRELSHKIVEEFQEPFKKEKKLNVFSEK